MKYAVIKNGGHQYRVMEGQVIEVELLKTDGKSHVFDEVLLVVDGDKVEIGTPTVEGMKVYADVVGDIKGDKIEVFKYKSKSRYRKHTGHRQKYTQLRINGIGVKKAPVTPTKAAKASKVEEAEVVKTPKVTKTAKTTKPAAKKAPAKKKPAAKKTAK